MAVSQKQLEANRKNAQKAGRPKASATLIAQEFRDALAKRIQAKADAWQTAIEDVALGHHVAVTNEQGEVVSVYKKSPDPRAWKEGMERAFGKAVQPVAGADGESPIDISVTVTEDEFKKVIETYGANAGAKSDDPQGEDISE